jgi:hypothetical protein
VKVTVEEAARMLGCSKANVYQQIKAHKIKTQTEMRDAKYLATRKIKMLVFELSDLTNKR